MSCEVVNWSWLKIVILEAGIQKLEVQIYKCKLWKLK